jgi:hypothetical protein
MIALSDKTSWLLDSKTGDMHIVEFDGELQTLREMMPEINLFDTIRLDQDNIIFVDDEGLLKPLPQNGFTISYKGGKPFHIAGSALITGDDGCGGHCAVTVDPSDIKISLISIYGKEEEEG